MTRRKSHPLSEAERQAKSRAKKEQLGLVRREFLLDVETVENERLVRDYDGGPDRVRQLISFVLGVAADKVRRALSENGPSKSPR